MVDIITTTLAYWINYVFGNIVIAGIFFMFFLMLFGLRRNWSIDMYIVILIPSIAILTATQLSIMGIQLFVLVLVAVGIVIALGLYRLTR